MFQVRSRITAPRSRAARLSCPALWLLLPLLAGPAGAAAQPAEPLQWIDDQVGLVIQLRQPAPALRRFVQGPLGARVAQLPPVRRWWNQKQHSLRTAFTQVAEQLGFSARELEQVALQRRLILSLWPPEEPGQDGKLLLLVDCGQREQALRLEQGLRRMLEPEQNRWQQKQEQRCPFWLHQKTRGDGRRETTVVGTLGPFVAVSNDLPTYLQARRYHLSLPQAGTLATMPAFQEAQADRLPETMLWVFVNLPVWEQHIRQEHLLPGGKPRDAEAEQLLRIWPALRYLVLGVRAGDHLLCYGQLAYRRKQLPESLARRLQALEGPSSGFALLPRNVVAAASVHVDLHQLLKLAFQERDKGTAASLPPASSPQETPSAGQPEPPPPGFVQAGVLAILSLLRPDHTAALLAYPDQEGVQRLGWAVALGLKPRWPAAQGSTTPEQALVQVLPGVASALGSLALGRKVAYRPLRTATGQVLFRPQWLSPGKAPAKQQLPPVFATAQGQLWVANAPEVLTHLWRQSRRRTLASHPCWGMLQEAVPEPHHRFFVSLAQLRRLLQQRPVAFLELLAPGEKHDPAQVAQAAAPAARLLSVADCAAATVQVSAREIRFALVILAQQQESRPALPNR